MPAQLIELRAADLRFSSDEAAEFLDRVMGLNLSADDIAALESRTEGWIAGLDWPRSPCGGRRTSPVWSDRSRAATVSSWTILQEVLRRQPEDIQDFFLRTSILDRFCGSLRDAVTVDPGASGQGILEYLERANIFIVPLDDERRWYRYHHLFRDLLRQRLGQSTAASATDGT